MIMRRGITVLLALVCPAVALAGLSADRAGKEPEAAKQHGIGAALSAEADESESPMRAEIQRDMATNEIRFAILGEIRVRASAVRQMRGASCRLLVYPNGEAAKRDVSREGDECLYSAEVTVGAQLATRGGFSILDFSRTEHNGWIVAQPMGISRFIRVPDASEAVVLLVTDADVPVPLTEGMRPNSAQPPIPSRFGLSQSQPNPASRGCTIRFDLPSATRVKLEVFDVLGRRVRVLTDSEWPAGFHSIRWDRSTDGGGRARAGVYLYRIVANSFKDQKRMVLLR